MSPILTGVIASGVSGNLTPNIPTIGTATAGDASASVTFTAAGTGPAATSFTVVSSPGSFSATGASSPITVTGLSNGTAYTFTVYASNALGNSAASAASNSITPAAQGSFESIQTIYLASGNQLSLNFDSIPSTFRHLQIRGNLKSQRGSEYQSTVRMRFNADSGNNYFYSRWQGKNGTANGFIANTGEPYLYMYNMCTTDTGSTIMAPFVLDIYNYSSTSIYKTIQANSGVAMANTDSTACKTGGSWNSTSAINAISFSTDDGSQFSRYSRLGLYGIKGA
jgi:hypothetical protein